MKEFDRLVEIVRQLRDPVSGCPWDIKQTPASLVPNFIEELYEVVEAIEDKDDIALKEELGDLMLHVVFQAQIASEEKTFDMAEVLQKITDKLVRRHPHVFGDLDVNDADTVKMNWERIKKQEKKERKSVLEGIPRALPALIHAQRTQEKAASVGFDWPDTEPIMEKLAEETAELEEALESGDGAKIREELGDMIFTLVNLARKLHIDAEAALKECSRKFVRRFNYIEEHYEKNGEDIHEASLEELDRIWNQAKET
ncbi:MAG: nucleoside triphosphate pyrophosphohydrolase [Candidatus Cloacimonetes bacterium HGW-Cloacimonetes-2]|jgi:MazG family protein|nr:MAG: nucleoside triphosphate pyrophosphohydrolase [Candidatus Cloacimonetes bacterium HGW-Cloacimonetes-2]